MMSSNVSFSVSSSFRLRIRFRNARSSAESFDGFWVRDIADLPLTSLIALTRRILLHPFLAAQNPGCEHVGQALRFCLSDLVRMKDVPARTCTARELGLDLGEETLNTKGAGLHGCWSAPRAAFVLLRATRSAISSMRASSCSSF